MSLQNTWDELKRSRKCIACGQTFKYGNAYRSKVSDGKTLNREEFCPECWDKPENQEYLYFWKGKYEPPAKQPKKLTSKEVRQIVMEGIHTLRVRLSDCQGEPLLEHLEILYLMVLFAERKKWIHLIKSDVIENMQTEVYETSTVLRSTEAETIHVTVPHSIKQVMQDIEKLKQYHERIENYLGIALADLK